MLTTTLALLQRPLTATAVFRSRVGLTALDLAEGPQGSAKVVATARKDVDAARNALDHSQLPQR